MRRAVLVLLVLAVCSVSAAWAQKPAPAAQLKYVAIISRHGVRSPTWDPARLDRYSAEPWPDWGVKPGELTPHGYMLMKLMGAYYQEWFAANGLLGPASCANVSRVFLRADNDQRTIETARAIGDVLLPGCKPDLHPVEKGQADALFDPLEAGLVKIDPALGKAAVVGQVGRDLSVLVEVNRPAFDELVRVLNGGGKATTSIFSQPITVSGAMDGMEMAGPLNLASTLTEDFLLEYTNGMSGAQLGWGRLGRANLQQIMALHTAYADLMRRTPYLAKARGSYLLSQIVGSMEQAVTGKPIPGSLGTPDTKVLFVSGHDTNLSNLSGMLGLSWMLPSYQPDDTPPGGALVFSLWQSGEKWSVRLQFVAQTMDQMHDATPLTIAQPPAIADVFIPGCSGAGEGYPCDWPGFVQAAKSTIFDQFLPQ